jgi:hypothetical protein
VVVEGLTLTAVPLVTDRLPGVITPVPFANTAVRLELPPTAIVAGFAVKLVIAGGGGVVDVISDDPPQPIRLPKPRLRARALPA